MRRYEKRLILLGQGKYAMVPGWVMRIVCAVLKGPRPWITNKAGWMRFFHFWMAVFGKESEGCDVLTTSVTFDEKELLDYMEGNNQ